MWIQDQLRKLADSQNVEIARLKAEVVALNTENRILKKENDECRVEIYDLTRDLIRTKTAMRVAKAGGTPN